MDTGYAINVSLMTNFELSLFSNKAFRSKLLFKKMFYKGTKKCEIALIWY